jgi:RHS repeat-associated protein
MQTSFIYDSTSHYVQVYALIASLSTGKERDTESGNDYFGARYYASTTGRWMSPDSVNVTEDRMMNPSSTLNKYAYGADNPLKYVDPDGRDITVFYNNEGVGGHSILLAYDPSKGAAVNSFGPVDHSTIHTLEMGAPLPISVPGKDNYGFEDVHSAQDLRDHYASITIQTSPEVTQEVINYIATHPGGDYHTLTNNCTTTCARILRELNLYHYAPIIPNALFSTLVDQYGHHPQPNNSLQHYLHGTDYGRPRPGYHPFELLFHFEKTPCFQTTVTINGVSTKSPCR